MNLSSPHDRLFARACDGLASAEELAELHRLLRADPAALDAWLHYSALHSELVAGTALTAVAPAPSSRPSREAPARPPPAHPRLQWLPQMAAGLVAGLFAATMVWAYVLPPPPKSHPLLEEDFETPAAPPAIRAPLETGIWRGDAAEFVGAQHGVVPANGHRMMRFLRADFEAPPKPAGGHIAVAYRLIDLRPFRREFTDGGAVVEVAASFNASTFPANEKYGCAISLYALDEDSVPDRPGRLGSTLTNDAHAMARSSRTLLDRDPATWQRVTTELRLPADAEFLVVRLHISQAFESGETSIFTGSYVDDVRIELSRRTPLP